jgi:hypothetical protein
MVYDRRYLPDRHPDAFLYSQKYGEQNDTEMRKIL